MRSRQGLTGLVLCLTLAPSANGSDVGGPLRPRLQGITGANAVNCGVFREPAGKRFTPDVDDAGKTVGRCISAALHARRGFIVTMEWWSANRPARLEMATGLAGTPAGDVKRFWYEAPCPSCEPKWDVVACHLTEKDLEQVLLNEVCVEK